MQPLRPRLGRIGQRDRFSSAQVALRIGCALRRKTVRMGRVGPRRSELMAEIVSNPKARRDFHILETFEAGIVLRGTEVKSLRAGKGQIADAFARVENGEVFLYNAHIGEYSHGNVQNHDPKAVRKLLLHKAQIRKLQELSAIKGHALLPLAFYWKNGRVKVALAVGRSKARFDKREDLKRRAVERELRRAQLHDRTGQ